MTLIYGLKNCDSCKKAMKWLASRSIEAEFVDVRDTAVPGDVLEKAVSLFGIDQVINRRSTTWRQLDDSQRNVSSTANALALIGKYPTLMKRPLLTVDGEPKAIGFSDKSEAWRALR